MIVGGRWGLGAGTVAAKTGRGAWCIITLGYGC